MKTRVTINEVARAAGVSAQTVSRVLNDKGEIRPETRQLVLNVIERLGYRPSSIARGLATSRTFTIGLVVPDIANPFFPEIARGIEDVAWKQGYGLFLCNTVEDPKREEAAIQSLGDKRVDGLIVCSARLPDERLLPLLKSHKAAVLVNRVAPREVAGSVRADDAYGAYQAVAHLLAGRRQAIGFLAGPLTSQSGRERAAGVRRALDEARLDTNPTLQAACQPNTSGGREAAIQLLKAHPDMNGLICYNDLVAVGALQACAGLSLRVPDDVAIVGFDDVPLAALVTPSLTTLRVPKYEIGADAARMLFERIQGQRNQAEIVHKPELVIRQSAPNVSS